MAKIRIYEKDKEFVGRFVAEVDSRHFFPDGSKNWEILDIHKEDDYSKATHFFEKGGYIVGICRRRGK